VSLCCKFKSARGNYSSQPFTVKFEFRRVHTFASYSHRPTVSLFPPVMALIHSPSQALSAGLGDGIHEVGLTTVPIASHVAAQLVGSKCAGVIEIRSIGGGESHSARLIFLPQDHLWSCMWLCVMRRFVRATNSLFSFALTVSSLFSSSLSLFRTPFPLFLSETPHLLMGGRVTHPYLLHTYVFCRSGDLVAC
jgi:hypothetical protein